MAQDDRLYSNDSIEQVKAFASTPAGKQFIAMLQKQNPSELGEIRHCAETGNMDSAKKAISALLSDPQIQMLLKQFGK